MATKRLEWLGLPRGLVFLLALGCSAPGNSTRPPLDARGRVVAPAPSSRPPPPRPDDEGAPFTDVAGVWGGTVGTGSGGLRLELTVAKLESGAYVGRLNSIDQGAVLRAHPITWRDGVLRFELKQVGGVFEGKLDAGLRVAEGSWVQSGATRPLVLRRAANAESKAPARETKERPGAPFTLPLEVSVPFAPRVFSGHGARHLAYELRLTNLSSSEVKLRSLGVLDGEAALETFEGSRLETILEQPGDDDEVELARLAPGKVMTAYIWLTLAGGARLPSELSHRLEVKSSRYANPVSVTVAATRVNRGVPLLHPPLRGGLWIAGNGPDNDSAHRRALTPIAGRARIAQRFATDWSRLGDDGKKTTGDGSANEHYLAHGEDVLAVAAGRVAAVIDGIPENTPGKAERAVPVTLETIGGNLIALELGGELYAFYAHLMPGSLRVKVGDRVRPGQVLARVGNSGNSTAPHLHFHVSTVGSILEGEGVPYELTSFKKVAAERGAAPNREEARIVEHECPMNGDVVLFETDRSGKPQSLPRRSE